MYVNDMYVTILYNISFLKCRVSVAATNVYLPHRLMSFRIKIEQHCRWLHRDFRSFADMKLYRRIQL